MSQGFTSGLPIDTDPTLAADSDLLVPSQKAVKAYADTKQTEDATLTALAGLATAADKIPYFTGVDAASQLDFVDEDDMASDSDTALPSQQSVKAYVDSYVAVTNATGTVVGYTSPTVYGSSASPESGNITESLTGAKQGIVQKMYHDNGTEPTYPAGWVLLGSGTYSTTVLNIIYFEWVGGSRVEYWIIQEA
jgi:hypothetical protein